MKVFLIALLLAALLAYTVWAVSRVVKRRRKTRCAGCPFAASGCAGNKIPVRAATGFPGQNSEVRRQNA